MTKSVGFLRLSSFKFVEQIVCFFSFLISLLFGLFFQYVFVYSFIYYNLIVTMGIFLARALQIFKGIYVLIAILILKVSERLKTRGIWK